MVDFMGIDTTPTITCDNEACTADESTKVLHQTELPSTWYTLKLYNDARYFCNRQDVIAILTSEEAAQ